MPSRQRRPRRAAIAFLCLAAPILTAGVSAASAAEPAAPGQVIGYAKADRSGAAQTWDLPPDKPYLYIPSLPAHLGGRIEAVETGPEVGVALFQAPYFGASDRGCRPALGSARRPDLAWLGATAHFAPAPEGQAEGPAGGYGSLIIYRGDLGPPPGALLLSRRATVGRRCENPAYNTVYNRIFVPMAEAPEAERCFDLVGDYPAASGTLPLDFVRSDRVVLLMPGDMGARYAPIRHDISVSLFDGLSCTGNSVNLNSRVARHRDSRLADLAFRDRGRSIRLIYDYGNADAFLVRRAPEPASPARAEAAPKPAAPILAMRPIGDPAIGPAPGAATASAQASKAGPEVALETAPEAAQKAAPAAPPAATAAIPPAAVPAAPMATPSPESSADVLAEPMAKAAPEPTAEPAPAVQAEAAPAAPPTAPPAAAAPQQAVAAPAAAPATVPKLSPVVEPPGRRVAALPAAARTFNFPVHEIYRLNHCLRWQSDCGEPAAVAWCRSQGFARALDWTVDPGIGADFPTVVLAERRVCAQSSCDGFKTITCAP